MWKEIKRKHNISKENNLYILKIDTILDNIPKIEYEVYYPFSTNNLTKLDLSICKDIKIDISIPVKISPNEINKYNMSSDIYNDICFTLTSENGTDKPLKEWQNEFIKNNLSLCEENCDFGEYNNDTKKAVCSCFTKVKLPLISEIKVDKEKLFSNFKDIRNIANFKMLKCYNLLLDKSNIFKNAANYMLVILFIISLISLIVFICYNYIKIKKYIQEEFWKSNYLKNKNINQNVNQNIIKNKNKNRIIEINKNKKKDNKIVNNKKNSIKKDSNIRDKKTKIKITKLKDNKKSSLKNNQVSKKINLKSLKINNNNNKIINIKKKFQKQIIFKNNINNDEENSNYLMKSNKLKQENLKINKIPEKKIIINNKTYNDIEINTLNYEQAIIIDKKTYCQYYISLLKTKHILIFTFFQLNDYNSQCIKIYIFFFIFAINFAVSAMFYSDSTMHKIYEDKGSFDFTYQLPQMFYSLIIAAVFKSILNILGIYEKDIIEFKTSKKKDKNVKEILSTIKIKISFFFVITYLLLFFFWIYLGCFCAVYRNTQIHLLKDVISSFAISFITPIFINLLPGFFRIPALKARGKRPMLFKFSKFLQMFWKCL